ncbi:MAG: hypothetical protein LBM67_07850 [Lentimicrobiaceae bacterium]|jgi:hypothetical protein|nr:hypothetical protein [Lentimicrobiaceae bacterium]
MGKDYFKYYGIDLRSENAKEKIEKALEIALDTRKFEIEMYWKRANYFWLFVAAIFVAWYKTLESPEYNFVVMGLGLIVSFAWFCVNRGSKFWQENWECHVSELTKELGYPVYSIIKQYNTKRYHLRGNYPYSVSKVNQCVSLFAVIAWICLIFIRINTSIESSDICSTYAYVLFNLLAIIGIAILLVVMHNFSKSFAAKDSKYRGVEWVES